MTRTLEVEPGLDQMPDYKSPNSRLVRSLRQGYDNLRLKIKGLRKDIHYYKIKIRDMEKSRARYKEETKICEIKICQLEKENRRLKAELEKKRN